MTGDRVTSLRCEYLVDPFGIDERKPRLSWLLESDRPGARQVAYRVLVASTPDLLAANKGDGWDSGRIEGGQCAQVVYAGRPLRSRDHCHWRVQVWTEDGHELVSAPAHWSIGLLDTAEWSARWIAADPTIIERDTEAVAATATVPGTPAVFRRRFHLGAGLRRATLYGTARGLVEFTLGGRRVGEDLFAPEWTDYRKRFHYRTYDVTALLTEGENELQATLGDGWWSGFVGWQETKGRYGTLENSLLAQLELEFTDGSRLQINSDETWESATGPILSSDFQMGEVYDARRVPSDWLPARVVPAPNAALVAQRSEPVRITELLRPLTQTEPRPGVHVFDLGQNISGWVRLKVTAPAGTRLQLRHAERLNPDGTLYTENLRRALATDVYICRGAGEEIWEPRFTFHGFQFIELTGLPGRPTLDTVTGCVIHSATPLASHFECSHPDVNRLWLNGVWSQRDNFLSVPTDCPQRDERLGWMGDAQVFSRTASYNADVAAFFTKWLVDVEDSQTEEGIFPDVAPRLPEQISWVGLDDLCGAAGWADAGIIIPWTLWRMYGDTRVIERHWQAMAAWLAYLERTNPNGLRHRDLRNNYGDWLCIPTDTSFRTHSPMKDLLATAYWADDAAKMAQLARALGRDSDAAHYQKMFEKVRAAFQREYVRPDGQLTVETQTAYLLALAFDLLPTQERARATERLVENIRALDWHLSTGFIGISHLNSTLTLAGRNDVAYRLLLQDTFPSWLYPVKHGATTIWERWNGWTHQEGFFNPAMNSFNHYSLGSVGEWLFRHVLGIEPDPDRPGFQHFILRPHPGPGLTHARGFYRSLHGEIHSGWRREGERFLWDITVPANTTARLCIPSHHGVRENGRPVEQREGLKLLGRTNDAVLCEAAPGRYHFESTLRS